jgi:hypothetical protein
MTPSERIKWLFKNKTPIYDESYESNMVEAILMYLDEEHEKMLAEDSQTAQQ